MLTLSDNDNAIYRSDKAFCVLPGRHSTSFLLPSLTDNAGLRLNR